MELTAGCQNTLPLGRNYIRPLGPDAPGVKTPVPLAPNLLIIVRSQQNYCSYTTHLLHFEWSCDWKGFTRQWFSVQFKLWESWTTYSGDQMSFMSCSHSTCVSQWICVMVSLPRTATPTQNWNYASSLLWCYSHSQDGSGPVTSLGIRILVQYNWATGSYASSA